MEWRPTCRQEALGLRYGSPDGPSWNGIEEGSPTTARPARTREERSVSAGAALSRAYRLARPGGLAAFVACAAVGISFVSAAFGTSPGTLRELSLPPDHSTGLPSLKPPRSPTWRHTD